MTKARFAAFFGVALGVILPVVACSSSSSSGGGGGFACDAKGKCSADSPPDQKSIDSCNAELKGSCATEYQAFGNCAFSKQTCTADNKTDSAKLAADCKAELDAYSKCKIGGADAGGGG